MTTQKENFDEVVTALGISPFQRQLDDVLQIINGSEYFDRSYMNEIYFTVRQIRDSADFVEEVNILNENQLYLKQKVS